MNISRRNLLWGGLGAAAALPSLASLTLGGPRNREKGERVLVVLQLTGGNDGLNTVVPHRQDLYYQLRPTLAIQRGRLHSLDDDHGLHPAMGEFGELYDEGQVACIQGVGYPNRNRSHFRSMEIWHTADPVGPERGVGWLGRLADQVASQSTGLLPAVHIGTGNLPLALRGESIFAPTVQNADACAKPCSPRAAGTANCSSYAKQPEPPTRPPNGSVNWRALEAPCNTPATN